MHSQVRMRPTILRISLLLLLLMQSSVAGSETADWSEMIERISTGVVSLKIDVTRSFDTEHNVSTQATGFVVDSEQGLILTNRHVVTPAPVRTEALFLNQEEVPLIPVYRDPVHDFGLFRYDPEALSYIQPAELALTPERAAVGLEVRIVGNDAGEQLSILSGTIARLDRRAPTYGFAKYNDFNTYYIQAASGSSGGSSGSPVLDKQGRVVALNASASSNAASSFFLPLDRVKRAVDLVRNGQPVTRGTLGTQFIQVAFAELRRLGLQTETEGKFRQEFPQQTGMLVVSNILRGGPGQDALQVGDILLSVNGNNLTDFVPLEAILDDSVGVPVTLMLERNGERLEQELVVADLHAITPSQYIEIGHGIVHNLSYQQAWHINRPIAGVYVAEAGYMFDTAEIPRRSVIVELDGQPVNNLEDFETVLAQFADRQEVAVRYFTMEDPSNSKLRIVHMDRRWFPLKRCVRDDKRGYWPCRALDPGPPAKPPEPATASFIEQDNRLMQKLAPSLVLVNFDMPYTISGVSDRHYYGTGIIVDTERGYIVVDRNTVPVAMGDVRITFAGSVETVGTVEFIHPFHNLALLSYDPALIGTTPVHPIAIRNKEQRAGDELIAVGLRPDSKLVSQDVQVASVDSVNLPLSRTMRFRESNLETLSLVTPPLGIDGVLVDEHGRAVALWSSFAFDSGNDVRQENKGVPIDLVEEMLEVVRSGEGLNSLEAEFSQMPLSAARGFGLSDHWIERIEKTNPERRQLLSVVRTVGGTRTAEVLEPGDLLLSIDGKPVTRFREVEKATQKDTVRVTVWRNKSEYSFDIATTRLDGRGVRRVIAWGGALLQAPYREMAAQRSIDSVGVYVAFFGYGSPASRYGLTAGSRIVEVDGKKVADLDSFLELVGDVPEGESVRLTTVSWNNVPRVITLKLDPVYWPTWEILYNGDWHRIAIAD
ncbi:MAG: PDZ domain-containing protein [Gammaproteobacteria bacterium]|nr:PDZ domain-containing protein [Gammaproteobacteria bacterium]